MPVVKTKNYKKVSKSLTKKRFYNSYKLSKRSRQSKLDKEKFSKELVLKELKKQSSTKSLKKRTPYEYMNFMDGEENRLLEKRHICKQKHCSKELDKKDDNNAIFEKEQDIACPQNMKGDSYYKCTSIFYDKSDYKKYFDNLNKCTVKNCNKYSKLLTKHRDKQIFNELNIQPAIGKLIVSKDQKIKNLK